MMSHPAVFGLTPMSDIAHPREIISAVQGQRTDDARLIEIIGI